MRLSSLFRAHLGALLSRPPAGSAVGPFAVGPSCGVSTSQCTPDSLFPLVLSLGGADISPMNNPPFTLPSLLLRS